jgi:hypothetical protein
MPEQDTPQDAAPPDPFLVRVRNHHGDRPEVPARYFETASYVSVFENMLGEQWIFTWRHGQEYGVLWGGDVDWYPDKMHGPRPSRWTLSEDERLWVTACWFSAAQAHHPVEAVRRMVVDVGPTSFLANGGFVARDADRRTALADEWRRDPLTRGLVERYAERAVQEQRMARFREFERLSEEELRALKVRHDAEADEANRIRPEEWEDGR